MRLPRMTTGRWMIAVAALAVVLGGYLEVGRLGQRSAESRARAEKYALLERYYRYGRRAEGSRAHAEYYAALRRKYERVARYPWLPVEPPPPSP